MLKLSGGNVLWIEDTSKFPEAKYKIEVKSIKSGYIKSMNTEEIGKIACKLGAGREKKDDIIDYTAGLKILKKTSDFVNEGDYLAVLYTNKEEKIEEAKNNYLSSLEFSDEKVENPKLVYEIIK